ncbi:alpha/beta hydrolase [Burkholderia pseudomallei]|uniref:alpha/beta hydrolase n=1 Tax=Burkholderia pseudomallei TaxID=28450 RepID=UPI0005D99838|nr:alpha/beta hydrolase [Burkholderia pseudomallei]AJX84808.1 phospholipase/Carboxylesterase family protein [Burkholderia pseudomallei 7894]ARK46739.1 Twin-arginine translocation pathway signal sequence domain protein [Burkholderia pseudomallei]ARK71635.1 Twin-arginine translocation pathway signal sequence domain protein [Burkholderia pseudomallei]ARK90581.1 Twin-arginine translocation pathway signal sequence domain protein [Burkholderia pseudomallei]ARL25995.1 Twin-arginine translocation path
MDITRRSLLGAALAGALDTIAPAAHALAAARGAAPPDDAPRAVPDETIPLWPGPAPDPAPTGAGDGERIGRRGSVSRVARPRLNVYRPAHGNGGAALVIAGGGYDHIELGNESAPMCAWLTSLGVMAFELVYRLPEQGWSRLAPLQDGQRAMRLIRARAKRDGVDPARIAIIGFSAGGHLAGMTAVEPDARRYASVDDADRESARPDLAALLYPVLTLMPPFDRTRTRLHVAGAHPAQADSEALSANLRVSARTPPTFLAHAFDDPIAPIDNSLLMASALRAARVSVELHAFQAGGHGWGMGKPGSAVHAWPALFEQWARLNRLLP